MNFRARKMIDPWHQRKCEMIDGTVSSRMVQDCAQHTLSWNTTESATSEWAQRLKKIQARKGNRQAIGVPQPNAQQDDLEER